MTQNNTHWVVEFEIDGTPVSSTPFSNVDDAVAHVDAGHNLSEEQDKSLRNLGRLYLGDERMVWLYECHCDSPHYHIMPMDRLIG